MKSSVYDSLVKKIINRMQMKNKSVMNLIFLMFFRDYISGMIFSDENVYFRVPPRFFVAGQDKSKSGRFSKSGRIYTQTAKPLILDFGCRI